MIERCIATCGTSASLCRSNGFGDAVDGIRRARAQTSRKHARCHQQRAGNSPEAWETRQHIPPEMLPHFARHGVVTSVGATLKPRALPITHLQLARLRGEKADADVCSKRLRAHSTKARTTLTRSEACGSRGSSLESGANERRTQGSRRKWPAIESANDCTVTWQLGPRLRERRE